MRCLVAGAECLNSIAQHRRGHVTVLVPDGATDGEVIVDIFASDLVVAAGEGDESQVHKKRLKEFLSTDR